MKLLLNGNNSTSKKQRRNFPHFAEQIAFPIVFHTQMYHQQTELMVLLIARPTGF